MKLFQSLAMVVSCSGLTTFAMATDQSVPTPDTGTQEEIEQEIQMIGDSFGATDDANLVDRDGSQRHGRHRGPCSRIKLEAEQKAALRTALFEHKKERITLAAEFKLAGLNYAKTVVTAESTRDDAATAGTAVATVVGKIATSRANFATTILYDVLTAEQRGPGLACMIWLKKKHHGHHGHGQCGRRDNNND